MSTYFPRRTGLALALATALLAPPTLAQQVVADGDEQTPAAGTYTTTEPVQPGNPAGYVFHALNGGSIVPAGEVHLRSEGQAAAAARAEGAGSRIALLQGSVTTTGYGAAGLSADNGGRIHAAGVSIQTHGIASNGAEAFGAAIDLQDVRISTHGNLSYGVAGRDSDIRLVDSVIEIHGNQANGLDVQGSTLLAERVRIDVHGAGTGISVAGASEATLRGVAINGIGTASGVRVGTGSRATLDDVVVELTHERSGTGLTVGGEVTMHGGRIHAGGSNATAVNLLGPGASLLLDGTEVSGHWGIFLKEGTQATLQGVRLDTEKSGVHLDLARGDARIDNSLINVRNGIAISVRGAGSTVDVQASNVSTGGDHNPAVAVYEGAAVIRNSILRTGGANAHGLHAFGNNLAAPTVDAAGVEVLTEGMNAYGATARAGGSTFLADSVLWTQGEAAHGVLAEGRGELTLTNTHVRTEGEGAWAAVINDNGRLSIDGGSLVSAQHGGVWVRSSRDPGLTLGNGALLSGGNGIALALDAAVAGRFDVLLDGRSQMVGDIVITPEDEDAGLVPQSDVHVRLVDGSLWQGASTLVQTMAIESGSQWTLSGDSTVGQLQVRDSAVALSDGSGSFNTLTVEGDLHSEGAHFLFNGALAGDESAVDRLHVRGDASGDASIVVRNIGGVGAATVDGIALIDIDGASLANYTLAGRAVAGSHEYFLFQGGVIDPNDGNWYLRSQWFDVCADDPNAPGCEVDPGPGPGPGPGEGGDEGGGGDPVIPPPVLRPEAGAYLANQSAALNMFAHRMHDRGPMTAPGDDRHAWARVGRGSVDFSAVGGQLAVDGTTSLLQIGSDVLRTGNTSVGVMLGSGRADSSVVSRVTGYSAKGRVRGTAVGVYATWLQDPGAQEGAYVDATAQYGRFANRVQGVGLERERYDARVASASVESGYTVGVWQGRGGDLYVQPQLQLSYAGYAADRHVESNGTRVDRADAGGLSGRAGVRVFGHRDGIGGRLQPYAGVNWLRGSGRSTLAFNGERLGADVPRNRYELQAGAELMLDARWSAWGGISAQRGDHGYRNVGGQVGMRMAW